MQKIIYRGFEVNADRKSGKPDASPRVYRGVTFMPTNRTILCAKTGARQLLYRGVVAA